MYTSASLLMLCHIFELWQVYSLMCAVCHTFRRKGQAGSGHQGNVMNLLCEPDECCCFTHLHEPVASLFWIIHLFFLFYFLGKHWSQNQGSARLPDSTLSQPLSPFSKTALPASFCLRQPIVCIHTVGFLQRTSLHLAFVPQSNPSQPIPHQNHFQFISRLSQCEEGSICIPE